MRPYTAVIPVYDVAGNVIETHEHKESSKSGKALTRVKQKAAAYERFSPVADQSRELNRVACSYFSVISRMSLSAHDLANIEAFHLDRLLLIGCAYDFLAIVELSRPLSSAAMFFDSTISRMLKSCGVERRRAGFVVDDQILLLCFVE
jgi:hypothetical protein